MHDESSTIRIVEISEIEGNLADLVDEVARQESRVIVEHAGTPVAAVVSAADLQRFDRLERAWEERTRALEVVGVAFADEPTDQIEQRVAQIVAHESEAAPAPRST